MLSSCARQGGQVSAVLPACWKVADTIDPGMESLSFGVIAVYVLQGGQVLAGIGWQQGLIVCFHVRHIDALEMTDDWCKAVTTSHCH